MTLPAFEYAAPRTIEDAISLRQEHGDDAVLMAGGLILVILLRERLTRPQVVVSLSEIPQLHGIGANGVLRLGAMSTHTQVSSSPVVKGLPRCWPRPVATSDHRQSATRRPLAAT